MQKTSDDYIKYRRFGFWISSTLDQLERAYNWPRYGDIYNIIYIYLVNYLTNKKTPKFKIV